MMSPERWSKFSLCEQMGHIGSEVARARIWDDKHDAKTRNACLDQAFDLIDLTRQDVRWRKRLKEICRLREVLADQYADSKIYPMSLADLEKYCTEFALVARKNF